MASQSSVKGLCKAAVTLVNGSVSPMNSGGTRHREAASFRVQTGLYASSLTPHCLLGVPTPQSGQAEEQKGQNQSCSH